MNQTFSLARFGRILRKYFTDNRGQLITNLALLVGILLVFAIFVYRSYPREADSEREKVLLIVGWALWYVFIMQQVSVLNQKERALNYLMQPASQFEKIALIWLVSGIGFLVVYLFVFTVIDALGIAIVNNRNWTPAQLGQIRRIGGQLHVMPWYLSKGMSSIPPLIWWLTAIFHAVYLMVSLMIRRYTLAMGVVLTLTVFLISIVLNNSIMQFLTGNSTIRLAGPFSDLVVESPDQTGWRLIKLPQPLGNQIRYGVAIAVALLAYVVSYVRFKEKEV